MNEIVQYAKWTLRVQAVLIDSVILSAVFIFTVVTVSKLDVPFGAKAAIVAFPIFVLEPGLVALKGATIGHFMRGIRVRCARTGKNLGIFRATLRFFVKFWLGWISILLVFLTKRRQAIHDLLSLSIVVIADGYVQIEETVEKNGYIYPSKSRRIVCIVLYTFLPWVFIEHSASFFISDQCFSSNECNAYDYTIIFTILAALIVIFATSAKFGWRGELWGCRRKPIPNQSN